MKLTIINAENAEEMGSMELINGKVVMKGFTDAMVQIWEMVGSMLPGGERVYPKDGEKFIRAVYIDYKAPGRTSAHLEEKSDDSR